MGLNRRLAVQVSEKDRELIEQVVKARGEDLSSFIRCAIRRELASLSFYPEDVKKALGMGARPHE